MKALRVVLIEDEPVTARNLAYLLQTIDDRIQIVAQLKSVSESVAWFKANEFGYDLAFIDVRLTDGLSFDIFKRATIRKAVIFVTAYHDYAIEAFKNNGIDYILKPFDEQEILRALHKYDQLVRVPFSEASPLNLITLLEGFNNYVKSYKKSFLVSYRDKLIPLDAAKIAWFYTTNEIVYATTTDGQQYIIDFKLEQLEAQLDPQLFFRANRQFIINRKMITEIAHFLNGRLLVKLTPAPVENILISKARVPVFKNWMNS